MFKANWCAMGLFFFTGVSLAIFFTVYFITKDVRLAMICSAPSIIIEYVLLPFAMAKPIKTREVVSK